MFLFLFEKMCTLFCSAYSVPFESSYVALERRRVTLSDFRVPFRDEYYLSPPQLRRCWRDRHDLPFEKIDSKLDMFHEQLPLPVPCYDLVLVTEFAVVLRKAVLRAPPAPLT